jgi:hypothetical protein
MCARCRVVAQFDARGLLAHDDGSRATKAAGVDIERLRPTIEDRTRYLDGFVFRYVVVNSIVRATAQWHSSCSPPA